MPRHSRGYWWDAQEKRWRIRFSLGAHGRSYRESLGPEWTEKQVIERVGNLRKQAVEGILGRQDRLISDALEVYLERAEAFKGYKQVQGHIKAIWPWIDGKRLSELGDVARNYRSFHRSKLSGATINRRVALLRRVSNIAWKELGWLEKPVFYEMAKETHRTTHLSMEQVEALAAATTHQVTRDAIWLAVCTGWRRGELWSLTQANVRGDMLWIGDTKNSEPRVSPVHDRIKDAVTRLPFPVGMRSVFRHFKAAAKAIGMPELRFHDLRHTTASLIINAGGTLKDVQEVLGHKSVATSNRYSHMIVERKRKVLDLALMPGKKDDKKEGAA
jgi:integrase